MRCVSREPKSADRSTTSPLHQGKSASGRNGSCLGTLECLVDWLWLRSFTFTSLDQSECVMGRIVRSGEILIVTLTVSERGLR